MSISFSSQIQKYTDRVNAALQDSPFSDLEKITYALMEARSKSNWIFLAGNGGSASTASHFANDLVKGLSIADKSRFKAKALCDSIPIMTALANDYEYSLVYVEQLKNYASAGDVLILFSGSGNSPNVVNAAELGKKIGMKVISFSGRDGGKIKAYSDICCIAPTNSMEEIEDVHLVWCHALVTSLRSAIEIE
jgi:D-sedoheptulose 7-phosphate isomerase